MSFNAVEAYDNTKKAFLNQRGGLPSAGVMRKPGSPFSFFKLNEPIPATTWGDVYLFSLQFLQKTDPCPEEFSSDLLIGFLDLPKDNKCRPSAFVHTSQFNEAKSQWLATMPDRKVDPITLASKITSQEIYPHNEAFWGYGRNYAFARNAAGVVEGSWSMGQRSIEEAIKELPDRLRNAVDPFVPKLPDVSPFASLVKWATIAGGLFLLYQYVLKPSQS